MSVRLLEAVPNFSEGRDMKLVREIADVMARAGADVLDCTSDAEHHRSVITVVGAPEAVEEAAVAAAKTARDRIDMRRHKGLHPRIGALDVLPFVPMGAATMEEAIAIAHRAGRRIALEVGIPVYFYGHASDPPGRTLAELRQGGYEALADRWPDSRTPDVLPANWQHGGAHPTAGAVCVGARRVLLAWNVYVKGVTLEDLRTVAHGLRESGGGIRGLRALAFHLAARNEMQISMNLEDVETASPLDVYRRLEQDVLARGGEITHTEVIGLVPDRLLQQAAEDRLKLEPGTTSRLLSARLFSHLAR